MTAPRDDALPPLNEPLIAAVFEQISAHPDSWDQSEWAQTSHTCGTTACFAGWAAQLNGHTRLLWTNYASHDDLDDEDGLKVAINLEVDTGEHVRIDEFAARVLGLTPDEATRVFGAPTGLINMRALFDEFRATRAHTDTDTHQETP